MSAIIVLFLLFIFAILFSMERMVFAPISRVTQALKSKAFDIELPTIEAAKTHELNQLIEAFQEMDEEVSLRQKALEHQAMHDHLTGLPNRFLLFQRIEYQLLTENRHHSGFALFLMDLDFFKEINDTLGHATGDQLLIEVSKRIQQRIRKSGTLARLGGDEFAALLPETNRPDAIQLAKNIIQDITNQFVVNDETIHVSISIGVVYYPEDAQNTETLMQYADMAMYAAKRKRSGYSTYDSQDNVYNKERLSITNELPLALENDDLDVFFQPKVQINGLKICGAEALIRWNHAEYGFITPEKIIEAAERIGNIQNLSLFVIRKALAECSAWHKAGHKLSISINLSVYDLSNQNLASSVKALLDQFQLDYHYLTFEITEGVMMENLASSIDQLNKLNKLGVCLSVDDFGTGFSSLSYLKRLPVNELKIDRSFIMEINNDQSDQKIVDSIIMLGQNLGLDVVAEGVENQETVKTLSQLGCDQLQGYYFSKPVDAQSFKKLLTKANAI